MAKSAAKKSKQKEKRLHFAGYDFTSGPEGTVIHRPTPTRAEFRTGDRVEYRDVNLTQQGTVTGSDGKWTTVRWDGRSFESREWAPNLRHVSTGTAHATMGAMSRSKTPRQLEAEIASSLTRFSDASIERMFKKGGGGHDKLVVAVLGDPMYTRRFKMPEWNIEPTVLATPYVAVRYWNELGIPRSKSAHAQRAEHFRELRGRFQAEHARLVNEGERLYGKNGPVISGGFHEGWPKDLKDRIRFAAQGATVLGDAIRLHEALSKSRSPVFQR